MRTRTQQENHLDAHNNMNERKDRDLFLRNSKPKNIFAVLLLHKARMTNYVINAKMSVPKFVPKNVKYEDTKK